MLNKNKSRAAVYADVESPLVKKAVQQARSHAPTTLRRVNATKTAAVGTHAQYGASAGHRVMGNKRKANDGSDDELNLAASPVHDRPKKTQTFKRAGPVPDQAILTWSNGDTEIIAAASTSASPTLRLRTSSRPRPATAVVEIDEKAKQRSRIPFQAAERAIEEPAMKGKAMSHRKRMYPTPESPERIDVRSTPQMDRALQRRLQGSPLHLSRQPERVKGQYGSSMPDHLEVPDYIQVKQEELELQANRVSQDRDPSYTAQQEANIHRDAIVAFVSQWSAEPWPPDQVAFIAATLRGLGLVDDLALRTLAKADALAQDRFFGEARKAGINVLWEVLMRSALDRLVQ